MGDWPLGDVRAVLWAAPGWFLQTDPVGYEDDLNLYAYVRNDPLNAVDPTGLVTVTLGFEEEVVTPNDPSPSEGHGAGIYINIVGDRFSIGTYTTTRDAAGSDVSVSFAVGLTGGDVANDFEGESSTYEVDIPIEGIPITGEGGLTSSGQLTGSLEIGPGLPSVSGGVTRTDATQIGRTVDVSEEVNRSVQGALEFGNQVANFIRDPLGALGRPGNQRRRDR